jgi:predicted RecB family nuclease
MTTPDLLTPTRITAWLGCAHTMTLATDGQQRSAPVYGSFARLLMDKGDAHEHAHLERLRAEGRDVVSVPPKEDDESFEAWAARSRPLLSAGHEVLFQFPFVHDGVRGVADFLERVDVPCELGAFSYEPVDAKLARSDAKPGHVLQLCFYADALEAVQGVRPRAVHLELGSGARESVVLATVDAYWRRVRSQLVKVLASPADTTPVPCAQCQQCRFAPECTARWIAEDALHRVASIRANEVEDCAAAGITTLTALATGEGPVPGLKDARLHHLRRQAALQLARPDGGVPGFEVIERAGMEPEVDLAGRLPASDDGDVFLDFEGDPVWRADTGLFFLFGALVRDSASADGWAYRTWWAHDLREEAVATAALIDWLADRHDEHPGMHVYHYNHTERSSLVTLADRHGARAETLERLIEQGVFVDLLEVVRHTVIIGAESYSLKQVERVAGYERSHEHRRGSRCGRQLRALDEGARAAAELDAIARYNEDDVRATLAVRDWLRREVLDGVAPRAAPEVADAVDPRDVDASSPRCSHGVDVAQLLGHLLDYWSREFRAVGPRRSRSSRATSATSKIAPTSSPACASKGSRIRPGDVAPPRRATRSRPSPSGSMWRTTTRTSSTSRSRGT